MITIFNNPTELLKSDLQQFKEQLENITHPTPVLYAPPKMPIKSINGKSKYKDDFMQDAHDFDVIFSDMPDFTARFVL
jgi:hypothetical protein